MTSSMSGDDVLKIIDHINNCVATSEKNIKQHCENVSQILIAKVQEEGCKGIIAHINEHKTKTKRFFGLITIIPATITAIPIFIKWLKSHL